ncbi:T9SS type A sorting domain-containing protein [Hymenobacter persicinus]|uniref:T9SS type A sorting domain-containing protein n=1 Tax=Hymenobacter persicinus TaxID=2025506 RepID=A0A4Q5L8C4_9BACT|nr:T9SS type A sorting domain-containing protein [Hymenobacter persicinus]RYU77879.1 hypothetical protein EWM57_16220 [Hymenobacter persicinus]
MPAILLRRAVLALVLLLGYPAAAQPTWQRLFGTTGHETSSRILPLHDGGYLLLGSHAATDETYNELYLVRTDARGSLLWTRRHRLPACTDVRPGAACENAAGQVLLTTVTTQPDDHHLTYSTGVLLLLQPDGSIAWSRRTDPVRGLGQGYAGVALAADGSFWVGYNDTAGSALLRLSAGGQELQRLPFVIPRAATPAYLPFVNGSIANLFRLPSGLYVYAGARLVQLSEQGVRGPETELPPLVARNNESNYAVTDVVALPCDEVLVVSEGQLDKVQLGSSAVRWTRTRSQGTLMVSPAHAAGLPDGHLLVFGTTYFNSHVVRLVLTQLDSDGRQLYGPPSPGSSAPQPLQQLLGEALSAAPAGLVVHPATGQVVVGGVLRDFHTPEEIFLSAGSFASLAPPTLAPLTAWPNPVTGLEPLTVPALFAQLGQLELHNLQGQLVRRWPTPTDQGDARLPMQDVPQGLYILTGRQANGAPSRVRITKQ